jgi:hypothetical protein
MSEIGAWRLNRITQGTRMCVKLKKVFRKRKMVAKLGIQFLKWA